MNNIEVSATLNRMNSVFSNTDILGNSDEQLKFINGVDVIHMLNKEAGDYLEDVKVNPRHTLAIVYATMENRRFCDIFYERGNLDQYQYLLLREEDKFDENNPFSSKRTKSIFHILNISSFLGLEQDVVFIRDYRNIPVALFNKRLNAVFVLLDISCFGGFDRAMVFTDFLFKNVSNIVDYDSPPVTEYKHLRLVDYLNIKKQTDSMRAMLNGASSRIKNIYDRIIQDEQVGIDNCINTIYEKTRNISDAILVKEKRLEWVGTSEFKLFSDIGIRGLTNMILKGHIKDFSVTNDFISCKTGRIMIAGKYDMGRFLIELYNNSNIYVEQLEFDKFVGEGAFDHPHVYQHKPCFGNLAKAIPEMVTKLDYYGAISMIYDFLHEYSPINPYKKLGEFIKDRYPEDMCSSHQECKMFCGCGGSICGNCRRNKEHCICTSCPEHGVITGARGVAPICLGCPYRSSEGRCTHPEVVSEETPETPEISEMSIPVREFIVSFDGSLGTSASVGG